MSACVHVTISDDIRRELMRLRQVTGASPRELLRWLPPGVTPDMVERWMTGKDVAARNDQLEAVLSMWRGILEIEWVEITPEIQKELIRLQDETGIGTGRLMRGSLRDVPAGLRATSVNKWMSQGGQARRDHLEYVLGRWRAFLESGYARKPITPEIQGRLRGEQERTGIGAKRLFRGMREVPDDLKPAAVQQWLDGRATTARQHHLEHVLKEWSLYPDRGGLLA